MKNKKSKHNLNDLLKRYVKLIEKRNPEQKLSEGGKLFLKANWEGKEDRLHLLIKNMENADVKAKNFKERTFKTQCTFQVGVDVLGFPQFVTHELLFQKDIDNTFDTRIIDIVQYEHN